MAERVQAVSPVSDATGLDTQSGARERAPQDLAAWHPGAAAGSEAEALRLAVRDAQGALAIDQEGTAARVNELLGALKPGEENGRLLLDLLETDALAGLRDAKGKLCRQEAVRALLRLGFPWALEIDPDALAWFRAVESPGGRRGRMVALALVLLAALGGGVAYYLMLPQQPTSEEPTRHVPVVERHLSAPAPSPPPGVGTAPVPTPAPPPLEHRPPEARPPDERPQVPSSYPNY
jgi:hypothetical protein